MAGESRAHRELKRAALFWAQAQGYGIAGLEIRVPRSRFRADVAAYRPASKTNGGQVLTAIFECKRSRPDFLSDSASKEASLERLGELHERRVKLERQLGVHFPHLRAGDSLFPEYESLCAEELSHNGYRKVMREIGVLQNKVYGRTKFEQLARYRCASVLYLVTTPGVMKGAHEVPLHWGHLELAEGKEEAAGELTLKKKPVLQEAAKGAAVALLERLAASGTRRLNRAEKIDEEAVWERRRGR